MSDVYLYQSVEGGEIQVQGGVIAMDGGLATAVYLSMFGGNPDGATWWGDTFETDPAYQYQAATGQLLDSIPPVVANLPRIESAAQSDLAWMTRLGAASEIQVSTRIPGINQIEITISVVAEGKPQEFTYLQNWSNRL